MEQDRGKIMRLRTEGNCCSQVIVGMGLRALGEENLRLMDAMSALCIGMHGGYLCGALSGAACLMGMFDKKNAASDMIPELTDWFEAEYGSVNCDEITGGRENIPAICPALMENTYFRAKQIMSEFGFEI